VSYTTATSGLGLHFLWIVFGKFVILRCDKISSQNMQYKRERIRQKSQVKNLPKQFGAENPRNGLCSFEQQEAIFPRILIRFWDNKLQFWPERLHILNKWGQNTLFLCFSVII
jgi:hypothetical protein